MSMTLTFLGGAPFQLLYDVVKLAIRSTKKFKLHLRSLKFTLDCLQPQIIEQLRRQNLELNLPIQQIEDLQRKIDEGIVLISQLSSLSMWNIRIWCNCCNCVTPDYAEQLDELNESLRRLLEILRLQSIAQVNEVVILAKTTRDRQDELGRRQIQILNNQQNILDILRKQQEVIERIERNGDTTSDGRGGAAPVEVLHLGAAFQLLFDALMKTKVKNRMFKRLLLEDIKFTLDCLKPLMEDRAEYNKVLHLPKEELRAFILQLEKGVELVYNCSKVCLWASYKKYEYINKLFGLDESLQRLFNILRLQIENDVQEALVSVTNLEKEIMEIEGNGVLHHRYEVAVPEMQPPTIGLEVMKMQVTRDVKETLDLARNVEVQQIEVPVAELSSPTIASEVMDIPETSDSAGNTEAGTKQIEGKGEKKKKNRRWRLFRKRTVHGHGHGKDGPRENVQCKAAETETTRTMIIPVSRAAATAAAVAAATAAAVAAVQAELESIRLCRPTNEHSAATVIQCAFRRYLARSAFRMLKGIIRFQALVRGHQVRNQARLTLKHIPAMARVKDQVRNERGRNARFSETDVCLPEGINKSKQVKE